MSDLVSEDHILARIASHFPNEGPDVLLGRGDDCAVLGVSGPLCVSTDLFMEDVHFRRSYFTPEDIGWKALAVNLSDLAADGARPMGFTVGLSLPPDADMALVDGLCAGMAELAAQASVPLVGGDLSRADKLHLCLTVFGQAEKTLLRGEAQPGDVIFLIGRTGLARAGLLLLEERGRAALNEWPIPCEAHLRPAPRLKEGMRLSRLARTGAAGKAIPPAGGLGSWIFRRPRPRSAPTGRAGHGRDIDMPMPHTEILRSCAPQRGRTVAAAKRHAFLGGEDYALIGRVARACCTRHIANAETTMLGKVTEGVIRVDGVPISGGFDHFAAR
ncbi:MAG: thiamine-phosphate kinase [Bilophila wadsworthia]